MDLFQFRPVLKYSFKATPHRFLFVKTENGVSETNIKNHPFIRTGEQKIIHLFFMDFLKNCGYSYIIYIVLLCLYVARGHIPCAERFGRSWAITDDALKPTDPRRKMPPIPGTNIKIK